MDPDSSMTTSDYFSSLQKIIGKCVAQGSHLLFLYRSEKRRWQEVHLPGTDAFAQTCIFYAKSIKMYKSYLKKRILVLYVGGHRDFKPQAYYRMSSVCRGFETWFHHPDMDKRLFGDRF
jgi:hypothetical protein